MHTFPGLIVALALGTGSPVGVGVGVGVEGAEGTGFAHTGSANDLVDMGNGFRGPKMLPSSSGPVPLVR